MGDICGKRTKLRLRARYTAECVQSCDSVRGILRKAYKAATPCAVYCGKRTKLRLRARYTAESVQSCDSVRGILSCK